MTSTRYNPEQSAAALQRAREAKDRMRRLRAGLGNGSIPLTRVLDHDLQDDELVNQARRLAVARVLGWVAGIGQHTVRRVANDLDLRPGITIGELTPEDSRRVEQAVEIRIDSRYNDSKVRT